jgi:hypothetical protein
MGERDSEEILTILISELIFKKNELRTEMLLIA